MVVQGDRRHRLADLPAQVRSFLGRLRTTCIVMVLAPCLAPPRAATQAARSTPRMFTP